MENDSDPDEFEDGFLDMVSDDDDDSYGLSDLENENSLAKRSKLPLVEDDSAKFLYSSRKLIFSKEIYNRRRYQTNDSHH